MIAKEGDRFGGTRVAGLTCEQVAHVGIAFGDARQAGTPIDQIFEFVGIPPLITDQIYK